MPARVCGGVELHWREWGAGPAIVALHPGPGADGALLGDWLAPLGDAHRVLALDLPDHGRSAPAPPGERSLPGYARAVRAFAETLGLGPYTLLGHSFGAFVALTCAVEHPGHAARVIASCGAAAEAAFDGFEARVRAFGRPAVTAAFEAEETARTEADLRAAWRGQMPFFCADPDGPACAALRARLDDVRFRVDVALDEDAFDGYDVRDRLAGVDAPLLAIAGAEDRALPPAAAAEIAALAPRERLVTIDGAGHFPYAERPGAYLDAVRAFAAG
ncbi:MAG: alpha/beta hydrolase [Solirubrobacteraceae bacterium]|nr:alpha/beta hydrolase [Solirubrobacteraceae bacterium]